MYTLLGAFKHQKREIPDYVYKKVLETAQMYNRESNKQIRHEHADATPCITILDLLHTVGTMVKRYPGGIPISLWNVLQKLAIGLTHGLRPEEIHCIAPASANFQRDLLEDGSYACEMSLDGAYEKGQRL